MGPQGKDDQVPSDLGRKIYLIKIPQANQKRSIHLYEEAGLPYASTKNADFLRPMLTRYLAPTLNLDPQHASLWPPGTPPSKRK